MIRSVPVVFLALSACDSTWDYAPGARPDTDVVEVPYFFDADGDGWGEFGSVGTVMDQPDADNNIDARNNRDCDDADPGTTGLTGSICPERLTLDGTDYSGVVYDTEFVVVHDDSDLVWPGHAEDACGPWGWGGALAQFADTTELNQVQQTLTDHTVYAGWVGVVGDGSGGWQWEDGTALASPFNLCPGAPDSDPLAVPPEHLALLKLNATTWCFGAPDQVMTQGEPGSYVPPFYEDGAAYFICERDIPDAGRYALDDAGEELP